MRRDAAAPVGSVHDHSGGTAPDSPAGALGSSLPLTCRPVWHSSRTPRAALSPGRSAGSTSRPHHEPAAPRTRGTTNPRHDERWRGAHRSPPSGHLLPLSSTGRKLVAGDEGVTAATALPNRHSPHELPVGVRRRRVEQLRLVVTRLACVFYQVDVFECEHISSVTGLTRQLQTVRNSNLQRSFVTIMCDMARRLLAGRRPSPLRPRPALDPGLQGPAPLAAAGRVRPAGCPAGARPE